MLKPGSNPWPRSWSVFGWWGRGGTVAGTIAESPFLLTPPGVLLLQGCPWVWVLNDWGGFYEALQWWRGQGFGSHLPSIAPPNRGGESTIRGVQYMLVHRECLKVEGGLCSGLLVDEGAWAGSRRETWKKGDGASDQVVNGKWPGWPAMVFWTAPRLSFLLGSLSLIFCVARHTSWLGW